MVEYVLWNWLYFAGTGLKHKEQVVWIIAIYVTSHPETENLSSN